MTIKVAATQMGLQLGSRCQSAACRGNGARCRGPGRPGRSDTRAVRDAVLLAWTRPTSTTSSRARLPRNPTVNWARELAAELDLVLPVSVFERANNALYNAMVMVDADGSVLGTYRKTHIPDAPGYAEKYYFNPGDSGFQVWPTRYGKIGTLICWDQWFPEAARILALKGAELILYPTAIGSWAERRGHHGAASLADRHAGACGGECRACGRLQPHRRRTGRELQPALLRLLLHLRPQGTDAADGKRGPAGSSGPGTRPASGDGLPAELEPLPRPAA